jgi:CHU_C Type IX secretion signal domain
MQKLTSVIWLFILWVMGFNALANPVKIRRICNSGNDNNLFWYQTNDTCSKYLGYIIWIRNGTSGSFNVLDTIKNKSIETYSHVGANVGGAKHWYYYIQIIDSCSINYSLNSDTLDVDNTQNFPSYIDSVSVNILTNRVILGWHQNKAPDFSLYDPFYQKTSSPVTYDYVLGSQGTRDTFIIDTNASHDPSKQNLKYDLGTRDSCGNTGVFGENPHQTIFLQLNIDTCNKKCQLSWTPYSFIYTDNNGKQIQIGWKKVRKYYLYKKINSNLMLLLDSVDGSILSYSDNIILGQQIGYFVRALKDTTFLVTSSSNLCLISTRERLDPINTNLINVSVDPITNGQITVSVENKNNEEWLLFNVYRSNDSQITFSKIGSISNTIKSGNFVSYLDVIDATSTIYNYQIHSINLCGIDLKSTTISSTILLNTFVINNQNMLYWNSYRYWQNGVEKYTIYRGIKSIDGSINFTVYDYVQGTDTSYTDNNIPSLNDGQGLCYYVKAQQNIGNNIIEQSNSNHSCIIGDLIVFVPNAFNPFGVNTYFRPEGRFVNYKKSSMAIYDRWGGKVIEIMDITNGWDGKDSKGVYCMFGVYLYNIKIIGTNGTEQNKSGLVTIIN